MNKDFKNMLANVTLNTEYSNYGKFANSKKIYILVEDVPKNTRSNTVIKLIKEHLKNTSLDIKDISITRDVNVVDFMSDYQYFIEGVKNIYDKDIERILEYKHMVYCKEDYKTWHLCEGTTNNLLDSVYARSWQQAKSMFKKEGYKGKFILEQSNNNSFKVIQVNI